jgi:hypothetical protein
MSELGTTICKRTMLFGAGLSKNYGGYLAGEVHELLMAQGVVRKNAEMTQLLIQNPNFEDALAMARRENMPFLADLESAIKTVYKMQNTNLLKTLDSDRSKTSDKLQDVFRYFRLMIESERINKNLDTSAYVFTLNQDILLERSLYNHENISVDVQLPGISSKDWHFSGPMPSNADVDIHQEINVDDSVESVNSISFKDKVNIIKLHGSADWKSASTDLLIVGGDKEGIICKSPLLLKYGECFSRSLNEPGMKLLIIGYGFWDEHINRFLHEAVQNNLEIWVWDTFANKRALLENLKSKGQYAKELASEMENRPGGYINLDLRQALGSDDCHPLLYSFFFDDYPLDIEERSFTKGLQNFSKEIMK